LKYFGTIAGPLELSGLAVVPPEGVYGMTVFVKRFIASLLRHGDFDELHFFYSGPLPNLADGDLLASDPRIRIIPVDRFAFETSRNDYEVLHNLWSPDIGPWTDLRNRLSTRNFPVTGLTHTISYQSFLPRVLATMLLGPRPWDSIVCTTESARAVMREWIEYLREEFCHQTGTEVNFKARLDKIPLGVDTEVFQPGDKRELRQRLGLPRDEIIGLYFGRFSHFDKMDLFPLLLAARKSFANSSGKPVLVMAGSDGFHKYSRLVQDFAGELGIADRVIIRTDVPDSDVPAFYGAADFFVSPSDSLQETFGQSIIEAMASGLPVICSDWDGYKELVVHEETGFRVPTYWMDCNQTVSDYAGVSDWMVDHFRVAQSVAVDVPSMANAIERLIRDEGLRRLWGANGRLRAQSLFDWKPVVAEHLALWRELKQMASAAPPPQPQSRTWYRPDFFRTFRHYPGNVLSPDSRLAPGWTHTVQFYPELQATFREEVFDAILKRAHRMPTVGELELEVTAELNEPVHSFRCHLLWLIKYGHLQVESPIRL